MTATRPLPGTAWLRDALANIRARFQTPEPFVLNPLLELRQTVAGPVTVHRTTDNRLVLSMNEEGRISPMFIGVWEPEFAAAIGEAALLLHRIHTARTASAPEYSS